MTEARVRMGFTLNLGGMQFAKVEVELMEEGGPDESSSDVYEVARDRALEAVNDALAHLVEKLEAEGWIPPVT